MNMIVDLVDSEIETATKQVRKYLEYIVDDIINDCNLKDDQIRIIWQGIEDFANQAKEMTI